jgi:hypothetical protein
MMLFQRTVTTIVISLKSVGAVYFRVGNCFLYCLCNFQYYLGGIFRGVFTNVLKHLPQLFLRSFCPNYFIPIPYHFLICFTNVS